MRAFSLEMCFDAHIRLTCSNSLVEDVKIEHRLINAPGNGFGLKAIRMLAVISAVPFFDEVDHARERTIFLCSQEVSLEEKINEVAAQPYSSCLLAEPSPRLCQARERL